MAALSINFGILYNYIEINIPIGAGAMIQAPSSGVGSSYALTAVAKQIDDGDLIGVSLPNPNPQGPGFTANVSFDITTTDCPTVDTWYMLTLYAWDTDSDLTTQSINIKRLPD